MNDQTAAPLPGAGTAQALPIFYRRPVGLNAGPHGRLRVFTKPDFGFARVAHAVPIMVGEMPAAMRSYPIVFVGAQKMPVIITGVRRDQNVFVDENGEWALPHYVPGYVRRYPFALAGDEGAERMTLCIDLASDKVTESNAEGTAPLFERREPSEHTRKVLAFCEQYQIMLNATRAIVRQVDQHGLFTDHRSTVTLESGESIKLTDFQVIDENALNALPDEAFLDLRRSGALSLVYCHLASMNSWASLLFQARGRA